MILTTKQKKLLRRLGHDLHPLVTIADQGLKETILNETAEALRVHELVKIKCKQDGRDDRRALIEQLAEKTDSLLVNSIGNTALLFKRNHDKPKISLKAL